MRNPLERYKNLDLRNSLSTPYRYPLACKELGVIIRLYFTKFPKSLQSLLFDDTLFAFHLLPQMQTQSAVSAASALIQSAESAFPKQKRALAATEFKQAKIAYKRRSKILQDDNDPVCLPQDVLVHLFCFLDVQSLLTAGLVCRMWNAAANDSYLWQFQYNNHFGDSGRILKIERLPDNETDIGKQRAPSSGLCTNATQGLRDNFRRAGFWQFQYDNHFDNSGNVLKTEELPDDESAIRKQRAPSSELGTNANQGWKEDFKKAYLGMSNKFDRAFCLCCKSIVWINNLKCPRQCRCESSKEHQLKPLSPSEIGRYIIDELHILRLGSDSDCDSDDDEEIDEALYYLPSYRIW